MTSTIIIVIIAGAVKCSIELLVLLLLLHVSSSAFAVERNTAHFFVARFSGSLSWFGCARCGGGAVYKKASFCRNHHCLNVPAARLGSATRQHPYWAPKYRTDCHVHRSRGYRITPHAEQDLFCCLQWCVMRTHQPGHRRRFHTAVERPTEQHAQLSLSFCLCR
jgi:hypothetical protein